MKIPSRPSSRTVESLGRVTYETKPNVSNLIAGLIIAAILVFGGLALSGYVVRQAFLGGGKRPETPSDWLGAVLLSVLGVGLAVGGVFLLLWVKSMFGFRLRVCRDGFSFTRGGVEWVFAWDEIVQVRETVLHERLPLVKGPARRLMPTKTSRSYTVVRCDGEEFYFDGNIIPHTSLLAGPLSNAAHTHGFSWETTEQRG